MLSVYVMASVLVSFIVYVIGGRKLNPSNFLNYLSLDENINRKFRGYRKSRDYLIIDISGILSKAYLLRYDTVRLDNFLADTEKIFKRLKVLVKCFKLKVVIVDSELPISMDMNGNIITTVKSRTLRYLFTSSYKLSMMQSLQEYFNGYVSNLIETNKKRYIVEQIRVSNSVLLYAPDIALGGAKDMVFRLDGENIFNELTCANIEYFINRSV